VERASDLLESLEGPLEPQPDRRGDPLPEVAIQRMVEPVLPAVAKGKGGLDFVERFEAGRQAGVERSFPQQRERECVDRLDRCAIEPFERGVDPGCGLRPTGPVARQLLEA